MVYNLKDGDRVLLAAFEDQPEEEAEVAAHDGIAVPNDDDVLCVFVDTDDPRDDGLREITRDQILRKLN